MLSLPADVCVYPPCCCFCKFAQNFVAWICWFFLLLKFKGLELFPFLFPTTCQKELWHFITTIPIEKNETSAAKRIISGLLFCNLQDCWQSAKFSAVSFPCSVLVSCYSVILFSCCRFSLLLVYFSVLFCTNGITFGGERNCNNSTGQNARFLAPSSSIRKSCSHENW